MAIDSRADQIAGIGITFLVLTSIATLLRIYCRAVVIKAFSIDDWFAIIAQFMFIVFVSYELTGVRYGTGRHTKDISPENLPKAMQVRTSDDALDIEAVSNNTTDVVDMRTYLRLGQHGLESQYRYLSATNLRDPHAQDGHLVHHRPHRDLQLVLLSALRSAVPTYLSLLAPIHRQSSQGKLPRRYNRFQRLLRILGDQLLVRLDLQYSPNFSGLEAADEQENQDLRRWYFGCWCHVSSPLLNLNGTRTNSRISASSATIIRFPYLYSLTDIGDFLYSTSDVAIWSTVETGLGITASAVATLRPLLRSFFGHGSSADGNGNSARPWQRTGSNHPSNGYLRSHGVGANGEEAFDLHDNAGKRIGVTTVIDHGDDTKAGESYKRGSRSEESDSVRDLQGWNSSQSELAADKDGQPRPEKGWNVLVKKTVVQTRGSDFA
jgi:hypothetical protein